MFFDFSDTKRKWSAKWIWDDSAVTNSWMNFRKKFVLDTIPDTAVAYISAESRYWLYVNGKSVVYEGSLKRGLNTRDGFFDEVDLKKYLIKGENTIYILAWFWGEKRRNFSSVLSGKPGLIFEADLGKTKIESDSSWKVARNVAYIDDRGTVEGIKETAQPTDNLPEFNIYYDGRLDMGDLASASYDDNKWANATEYGTVPTEPWNELLRRCIPLWKDYGLKDYKNSKDYEGITTTKEEKILLFTEYNCQMVPFIELETDTEGLKIDMYAENIVASPKCAYVTRKGRQAFQGLSWFNGERVYYVIPAGVTVKKLMYRETGYDTDICGFFRSDDEYLNKLWTMSARTLYITMRDGFMDCPDRERSQWWGDATNEMMMLLYCLDTRAYALYEKAWYTKKGFINDFKDKILRSVAPIMGDHFELPAQELTGICGLWEYYLYSGNKQLAQDVFPYVRDYLYLWELDESGALIFRKGSWSWHDWGDKIDELPLQTAWYYLALGNMIKLAKAIGKDEEISGFEERRESIRRNYEKFFTPEGFKSQNQELPDDRANAVAVIADLCTEGRDNVFKNVFNEIENSSPYMEKYVYDAMTKVNTMEELQARMKRRFDEMVNGPEAISTLWEHWTMRQGTRNHAWSGGALITMSKDMAGIRPTSVAYDTYEIAPSFGTLKHIDILVPTVKGNIKATLDKGDPSFTLSLSSPANTVATVTIPLADCKKITVNGITAVDSGKAKADIPGFCFTGKNKFTLSPGEWTIKAE